MLSLHQLTCFLATYEAGSLTAAAPALGYPQPSVSEQIRSLEKSLGVTLFERVGRGVLPTSAAESLRPYAEATLAAADQARRAVQAVKELETGTIRFGVFGISRLYLSATLIGDVLDRYPGVRVELIGQNSSEVLDDLRRGRIEAALVASPASTEGLEIIPVARDELVYISVHPERVAKPVTAKRLAESPMVLPETSFASVDATRGRLRQMVHEAGFNPRTRVEVEDVETAVEVAGAGYADTVIPRGAANAILPRLAPDAGFVSLSPALYETFAIVHRTGAHLSPAAQLMIKLATERILQVAEPLR